MCVRWTCPRGAWWWTGIPNSDVAGLRGLRIGIMRIDVVSLFPDFVLQCAAVGVVGRAQQRELLRVQTWNPRDYSTDRHRTVDSGSYGGGPGMVMMIEPLRTTLAAMRDAAPE